MSNVLELKNVIRDYEQGGKVLHVLKGIDLNIKAGELVALVGPSGSGKTTLLQIAGLLDTPTSGEVLLADEVMSKANDRVRTAARRKHLGFIYQFHHLLKEFSALENVMMPLLVARGKRSEAKKRAEEMLQLFGLKERMKHRPAKLSGGEQQRVAIARALAAKPKLLLADEPTGNLDPETGKLVFDYFKRIAKEQGVAALIATHNMELAGQMDRVVTLKSGQLA